jgi:FtsZ-binding cell division protein ZapB
VSDLGERLLALEQQVQRALELIERLRAENARLVADRAGLVERIETLTKETDVARQREPALTRLEADLRRLQEERQTLLGHVEGMLKELARIDLS